MIYYKYFIGIEQPTGLAIDYISGIMFVSSSGTTYNHISACNLEGEYSTMILSGNSLYKVTSLAVDPAKGILYWAHTTANEEGTNTDSYYLIEQSAMDGSDRKLLFKQSTASDHGGVQSMS